MKNLFFLLLIFIFLILGFSSPLFAYSSVNIPIESPVYRKVDKLIAMGLIPEKFIYGHRPWSRKEVARILAAALQNQETVQCPSYIVSLLNEMKQEFHDELQNSKSGFHVKPLESSKLEYTFLDSPLRIVPASNGLGNIDAIVQPLRSDVGGRHFVEGHTFAMETIHYGQWAPFFSFYGNPRMELLVSDSKATTAKPILQQGYGKFAYKNFEMEVGRDSLIWGQGETGGLLLSNNARPLDMVKLTTSAPFYHPGFLKHLGPSKYTFFVANLGPEQNFPYPFLYGLRASIHPFSLFELGLSQTLILGGEGSPSLVWYDPVSELVLIRRGGLQGQGSNVSDHRMGVDWRLRIPPLHNAEWYFESVWDDLGRHTLHANFTEQMGFMSGFYFPLLTSDEKIDLRIEYIHLPPILYHHGTWLSGYALNRRLIGSEVSPDGDRISVVVKRALDKKKQVGITTVYENRDSDLYRQTISPEGGPDRVVKTANNPTEHRYRMVFDFSYRLRKEWSVELQGGYERVQNFNFTMGDDLNNFLSGISIVYLPQ